MRYYTYIPFKKLRKMYRKERERKENALMIVIGLVWVGFVLYLLLIA